MNIKYRAVFIIIFLLIVLSMSLSFVNYYISLQATQEQLKTRSLPLSTDNIYTEIQKHIIEPNLLASMMASDTFLKKWLISKEDNNSHEIKEYLEAIKNKYGLFTTFLASEKTKNYYTAKGFTETMKDDNPTNQWYYDFKNSSLKNEINLDYNKNIDNSMLMFINHKIYDNHYNMLGATGVGFKISYIDEMLKKFRVKYDFKVCFIDEYGYLVLYERALHKDNSFNKLHPYKDNIVDKKDGVINVDVDGEEYLINVKYIEELELYLVVEAKVASFTHEVKNILYMNLFISIFVTLVVGFLILRTVHNYNEKLEHMAGYDFLTNLPNRRTFNTNLKKLFLLNERQKNDISLIFFDVDNFKQINDLCGHNIGDEVLVRIADILRECIRQTDLIARWGGEEFIVALIDSSLEDSKIIAEKLRVSIESDRQLKEYVGESVTASFGLTLVNEHNKIIKALQRVDEAMYKAKESGKNRVYIS